MRSIIEFFSVEMERPNIYGWFHILWIILSISLIVISYINKNKFNDKQLNKVLKIYGFTALVLELIKQVIWSYNLDNGTWSYQWYAAPFQLCTTPIYASLIAAYTKNKKLKYSLMCYIAFITFWGSLTTFLYPDACFVRTIEVNIHTMFLHCGSLVLSFYLMFNVIKKDKNSLFSSYKCFLVFETIAFILNIVLYNTGILHGATFNMFYISPYFTSVLPVFNTIQENVPYIIFLIIYNFSLMFGGFIVYKIYSLFKKNR